MTPGTQQILSAPNGKVKYYLYFLPSMSGRLVWNWPIRLRSGQALIVFFGAGRRFHSHNPLWQISLRSFWPLRKLGLNWVCFFGLRNHRFFCNPLLKLSLHSFWLFGDWVWLGLNWVCFDQVSNCVYFHKPLCKRSLRHFGIRLRRTRLGLFCIKRLICRGSSTDVEVPYRHVNICCLKGR